MKHCRWTTWLGTAAFAGALALMGTSAGAQTPGVPGQAFNSDTSDIFELDRNAVDDNPVGLEKADDWDPVIFGAPTDGDATIITRTGVLQDPPGFSIFVQGSKDIDDIPGWTCRDQGAPDKDELTNAYAIAYDAAGDLIVYFGADRFATNGDATMGFWLLQTEIDQDGTYALDCLGGGSGDGKFRTSAGALAEHVDGDLLIVADYTNGAQVANVVLFEWQGGNLVELFHAENDPDVDCSNNASGDICATVNQQPEASPWEYIPKGAATDQDFPTFAFMEGGINVSALFGTTGDGQIPCFSSFIAETRSSTSRTASQKDFVLGSFNVCGIDVTKVCENNVPNVNVTPIEFTYDVGGCLINDGFGTVTGLDLSDNPDFDSATLEVYPADETSLDCDTADLATLATAIDGAQITNPSTYELDPSEVLVWFANFTSTTNGGTDTVTATATGVEGAAIDPASDTADCPSVQFNPELRVTKACSAFLDVVGDEELVLKVTVSGTVCNAGDTPLQNVQVNDDPDPDGNNPYFGPQNLPAQSDPDNPDCDPSTSNSAESYSVTYTPDEIPTPPAGQPNRFAFSDQVTATGLPPNGVAASTDCPSIGDPPVVTCIDMATAECQLCPDDTECPLP